MRKTRDELEMELESCRAQIRQEAIIRARINNDMDHANKTIDDLKRQLNWHRQISQNLSEAICARMRNI